MDDIDAPRPQPWEENGSSLANGSGNHSTATSLTSHTSLDVSSLESSSEQYPKVLANPCVTNQEEIVISGISCRLPQSNNMHEFRDHLMNGEDMITESDNRWEPGFYDLPKRQGIVKELTKFDAGFFAVHPKQAAHMDPQLRLLLEVSYEALIDAGVNPLHMRGTRTGVFVGCSGSETSAALTKDPETIVGYSLTGCVRSMFANRLSYAFDFRGPSFAVDTACSSSLLALQLAMDAIRQGQCDAALVAGSSLTLAPTSALQFLRLGMLSPQGKCQSFDANGDGYVRSEGIVALVLQRQSVAFRCYATLVHAKSNTDGYKEQGITFPSGERQAQLLTETYEEAGVDPADLTYLEAHGTGTKVGDPQEANALCETLCRNKRSPLYIGSVKSNMGHAEPASGLAAVAKVLIAMETGYLPANLHFRQPNPNIPGLLDGRLKVITEKTPWTPGYVGINSFGFGGSNTHVILKPCQKSLRMNQFLLPSKDLPQLLCYSGRTESAVQKMFNYAMQQDNCHLNAILGEQAVSSPNLLPYRGFTIMNHSKVKPLQEIKKFSASTDRRPLWFIYSGMGTQWAGMGREMMSLDIFRRTVDRCSAVLEPLGVNVKEMIMTGTDETFDNDVLNCFTVICCIQLAMSDVLKAVGLEPDGIIGHSTGEMAAGYCDGCTSAEETMLCAFYRGKSILDSNLPLGAMAAIGLSWEEVKRRLPPSLDAACHNCNDSVTVSGLVHDVLEFTESMKNEGIFAKTVNSSGIPFHSKYMKPVAKPMQKYLSELIPSPRTRSLRWISSSVPENECNSDLAQFCSSDYHTNNVLSPVLFREALSKIPENSVIIEIAPHCLLQAVIKRTVPLSCTSIGLSKAKQTKSLESFLLNLGRIYASGINLNPQRIYPTLGYPVPRGTPMLSPVVQWDHSQTWPVMAAGDAMMSGGKGTCCHYNIEPFAPDSKDAYILDHVIDGRILFPFTGFLELAWKTLCRTKSLDFQKTAVLFENVTVYKPTLVIKTVKFDVTVSMANGDFEVLESDSLVASGRISLIEDDSPCFYNDDMKRVLSIKNECCTEECSKYEKIELSAKDIYKELLLCGYEYGPRFRGILKGSQVEKQADLIWDGNWVTFLDAMLQCTLLAEKLNSLRLPTHLRRLRIDPKKHLQSVTESNSLQLIRSTVDVETQGCYAGGVEFCELKAQSVIRRVNMSNVTMENVVFVPYYDSNCVGKERAEELVVYRTRCQAVALENASLFVAQNGTGHPQVASDDSNLSILRKIAAKSTERSPDATASLTESVKDGLTEDCSMLAVLLDLNILLRENSQRTADHRLTVQCSFAASAVKRLKLDKAWNEAWLDDRSAKVLLDIVCENTAGHHMKIAVLEPRDLLAALHLKTLHGTHPLLDADWLIVDPDINRLVNDDMATSDSSFTFHQLELSSSITGKAIEQLGNRDLIILDRILHTKVDIPGYLRAVCKFLRDDGFLLICEITQDFETAYTLLSLCCDPTQSDFPTNRINGFRKYGLFYEHKDWLNLFEKTCGLFVTAYQFDKSLMTTLYLLRKVPRVQPDPTTVYIDDVEQFSWIESLQRAIEERLNDSQEKTIWLQSKNVLDNGTAGLTLCLREESYKNRTRCLADVSLSTQRRNLREETQLNDDLIEETMKKDLTMNLFRDGTWGSMRHIPIKKDQLYTLRNTEHAFVNTLIKGDLSSLSWVESGNKFWQSGSSQQSLCDVHFASLNFRDVMLATGRLTADAIPGSFVDRDCLLGMEYAGQLRNTGERVMGLLPAQGLATTTIADQRFYWIIPEKWSFRDAATVPVVYSTAYYALMLRGQLQKGERLLIHSGTGGVGQAAIRIALSMGCEIYATVGSEEKKRILMAQFPQLNENHIGNSRTTDFELQVRKMTKGRGVDIVLNSLSDDKLHASVRCLAKHGRFLEIGKFDLANNTNLGMAIFLKNVTFHGILLDSIFDGTDAEKWNSVYVMLKQGIENGVVQPLPSVIFGNHELENAFRFMAHGKHIGKVLIKIRDEETNRATDIAGFRPSKALMIKAVRRTLCNPGHVYVITGGLGGFGLELTKWLISRGAKKLVLSSRSGVRSGYQARCIGSWLSSGVSVRVSTLNIADPQEAERLVVESCQDLNGPLGGLFHLAMVLRDCLFENQSSKNFKESAEAKYYGTKNLDIATRRHCGSDLKWFVVFSSISCGRGNAGQTNYGWANSTMERVVEQRRSDGLCGLAVQWGAIGDVGVVVEQMGNNDTVVGGTLPQRLPCCLQALDAFLCSDDCAIVSTFVKADTNRAKLTNKFDSRDVVQTVAHILGISDASQLDPNANFADLGLDSLMGVEIKQSLERDFELVLSMKDIKNLTLNKLREIVESGKSLDVSIEPEQDKDDAEILDTLETSRSIFDMFRLRMDVNSLRPEKTCVLLNGVTSGTPIFCVHSIEGVGDTLSALASKLDLPVYAFQYTPKAPQDSIEHLAQFYIQEMKAVQPYGPYNIIGYSFGASVAFEMATFLQQTSYYSKINFKRSHVATDSYSTNSAPLVNGFHYESNFADIKTSNGVQNGQSEVVSSAEENAATVGSLILLDGSHRYVKLYRTAYRAAYGVEAENLLNDALFETEALCGFALRFAPSFGYKVLRQELLEMSSFQRRIDRVVSDLMTTGLFKSRDTVEFAAIALCRKMQAADRYEPMRKFEGNVTLIRAESGTAKEGDVGQDFGLSEVTVGSVDVHIVPGDHDTFIHGSNAQITADIIKRTINA